MSYTTKISSTEAVTSALVMGSTVDAIKANACEHPVWQDQPGVTSPAPHGCELHMQRCRDCCATRAKLVAPDEASLNKALGLD